MDSLILNATSRNGIGKGVARKARTAGRTPGVVYRSGGAATSVSFAVSDLAALFRKTADPNSLIGVSVEGAEQRPCMVREVQRHPVTRAVLHVDFYEVAPDHVVNADVSLVSVGKAAGTRAGGALRMMVRTVRVECASARIPRVIEVDVSALEVGEFLKMSDVPAPEGVKIVFTRDCNVVTVEGKRAAKEDGAAGAPAGKPAAGGKAAPAAKAAPAKAAPAKAAPAKPAPGKKA